MNATGNRQPTSPAYWSKSSQQQAWWSRIAAAPSSVLMLDYDGTLAPFRIDRMSAVPYPGVNERLEKLFQLATVTVVLVTGRSASELHALLPFAEKVEVWCSHGREHRTASGEYQLFELSAEQAALLARVEADLEAVSLPASSIERKHGSLAIHWRGLEPEEQETIRDRVLNRYRPLSQSASIDLLPFADGLEFRATGRNKADAVRAVAARWPAETPIAYLGDDLTDEDAFGALRPGDLALLVRDEPRSTLADYWFSPPQELLVFLDQWIAASSQARSQLDTAGTPA